MKFVRFNPGHDRHHQARECLICNDEMGNKRSGVVVYVGGSIDLGYCEKCVTKLAAALAE